MFDVVDVIGLVDGVLTVVFFSFSWPYHHCSR